MLKLDVGTLAFSAAMTSIAAALLIFTYRQVRRGTRQLDIFAVSFASYGVGVVAILLNGAPPPYILLIGGNILVVVSACALHAGASALVGRRPMPWVYSAFCLATLAGYLYYSIIDDSMNARIGVISLLRMPVFAHTAWIIAEWRRSRPSRGAALVETVSWVWAALLLARSVGAIFVETAFHDFAGASGFQAFYFAASGLGCVLIAVGLLRLDAEKEADRLRDVVTERTETLQHVLDSAGEAIYGVDADGRCTFANPACLRLLGYDREADLVGKPVHAMIHHSHPDGSPFPVSECLVHPAVLSGRQWHADSEVYWRHDGTSFQVEYWAYPMFHDGGVVGAIVTFCDISDRKRSEQVLQESERRFRHAMEATHDGLWEWDIRSDTAYFSPAYFRMLGYEPEELPMTGQTWRDLTGC